MGNRGALGESGNVAWDMPSLLRMCPGNHADLLKIDIEGGEQTLFSNNAMQWLPQVGNICVEMHGPECEKEVIDSLNGFSYQTRNRMLGFQSLDNARVVLAGIEFAQKIKKQQYGLRRLGGIQTSQAQMAMHDGRLSNCHAERPGVVYLCCRQPTSATEPAEASS